MIGSYRSGVRLRSSKAGSGSGCQRRLNARAASNLGNNRVDVAHRVRIFFNSNLYSTALWCQDAVSRVWHLHEKFQGDAWGVGVG